MLQQQHKDEAEKLKLRQQQEKLRQEQEKLEAKRRLLAESFEARRGRAGAGAGVESSFSRLSMGSPPPRAIAAPFSPLALAAPSLSASRALAAPRGKGEKRGEQKADDGERFYIDDEAEEEENI